MPRRISIRTQLLGLVAVVVLPLVGLETWNLYRHGAELQRLAHRQVLHLAQVTASETARFLGQAHNIVNALAARPGVRALDAARCDPILKDLLALAPRFANAATMRLDGWVVCSAVPPVSGKPARGDPERFIKLMRTPDELTVGKAAPGVVTGRWVVPVGRPLLDDGGKVIGAVVLPIDLQLLPILPTLESLPPRTITGLVATDGTVLARSMDAERFIGTKAGAGRPAQSGKSGTAELMGIDGIARIQGFAPVPGTDWIAIASIPAAAVVAPVRERIARDAAVLIGLLLAVLLVAGFLARRIAGPVRTLGDTARKVVEGNLAARAPLSGAREVVAVAAEFNRMLDARETAELTLRQAHEEARQLIDNLQSFVGALTPEGLLIEANRTALLAAGLRPEDVLGKPVEDTYWVNYSEESRARMREAVKRAASGETVRHDRDLRLAEGRMVTIDFSLIPVRDAGGRVVRLISSGIDITERKRAESLLDGQRRVLEMVAVGSPLADTLDTLLRTLEALHPDMLGSILLLEPDGKHVRHGAAPSLPPEFVRAVDGQPIGERAGSCGTALYRREAVIVEDIETDPLWEDYRALARAHALRACWSTPIFDAKRQPLGSFAMYFRQPRRPTAEHLALIERATSTAAIAIARDREERALRELARRLIETEETERSRINRELHDRFAANLAAASLGLASVGRVLPAEALAAAGPQLDEIRKLIAETLAQSRDLMAQLSPPALADFGLLAALRAHAEAMKARTGFEIAVEGQALEPRLPIAVETALFRIAQEALANAAKHGGTGRAEVRLQPGASGLELAVRDEGAGFDPAAPPSRPSWGLRTMHERAEAIGAALTVKSSRGAGTLVTLTLPKAVG